MNLSFRMLPNVVKATLENILHYTYRMLSRLIMSTKYMIYERTST